MAMTEARRARRSREAAPLHLIWRAEGAPTANNGCDSDVALVVRLVRGDHGAMAVIFGRHAAAVHSLATQLCGAARADEVVQEVFLRLWQRPERFDVDRGSLRAFLLTNAHGRAVDLLRSEGARRRREVAELVQQTPRCVGVDDDVASGLFERDMAKVVATLPRRERDPIVLAYFGGHTYREVAEILEQPEGTIKSRIRSGLARLRSELQGWHVGADVEIVS